MFAFGGSFHRLGCRHGAMSRSRFHRRHRRHGSVLFTLFKVLNGGFGSRLVVAFVVERVRTRAHHTEVFANQFRRVLVQRAGVGLLFGNPQLGEQVENALRLYLELSRQLVNPNFAHN
jgi:hypothetical protein